MSINTDTVQGFQRCLEASLRYLSYRSRSEQELNSYLRRRGFDECCINRVIIRLREQGLVDDITFAESWKEYRERLNPRSRATLRQELLKKGIDSEVADGVLDEVDDEFNAYRVAKRKENLLAGLDYSSFRHKLSGFLKQRGFNYEVCKRTVDCLWRESREEGQDV